MTKSDAESGSEAAEDPDPMVGTSAAGSDRIGCLDPLAKGRVMVKQVGIMSMQRIINYGSSLQAYGLRRLIERIDPDCVARFVDYHPGPILVQGHDTGTPWNAFQRRISKLRKCVDVDAPVADRVRFLRHSWQHAFKYKREYASRNFPTLGIPDRYNYDLDLDIQVVGSDEVFNCLQANPRVGYARDLFGHSSPAKTIVSYAASFGNTTLEKLQDAGIADAVSADLSRFSSISVRDKNSASIVESLTGRVPTINVDPVLAHDFMRMERQIPAWRMSDRPYMIVYAYPGRLSGEENRKVRQFADRRGLDVLAFGGAHVCADRFIDCTPFELLAYFRDADAVVTDTFHGTIFALINHRPFASIVRPSSGNTYGNAEKLGYLLQSFGLPERCVADLADLDALLDTPLDGPRLDEVLKAERRRSGLYLDGVLAGSVA